MRKTKTKASLLAQDVLKKNKHKIIKQELTRVIGSFCLTIFCFVGAFGICFMLDAIDGLTIDGLTYWDLIEIYWFDDLLTTCTFFTAFTVCFFVFWFGFYIVLSDDRKRRKDK